MPSYVADLESDNLLDKLTVVHSLVLRDVDTNEVFSCTDHGDPSVYWDIAKGLRLMQSADAIYMHNGIRFDYPALRKVYPWWDMDRSKIKDTLVIAQMRWAHIKDTDASNPNLPAQFRGRHSLEAWGHRLGVHKGDYTAWCKERGLDPWSEWRPEMQAYCEQDTETTLALLKHIRKFGVHPGSVATELTLAWYLAEQEANGVPFDLPAAIALQGTLASRRAALTEELVACFGSWTVPLPDFTPKRDNKKLGYVAGVPVKKSKVVTFNPGSRPQIARRLTELYGWKPTEFTKTGAPEINEQTLKGLTHIPQVKLLSEYLMVEKRLGQLVEGKQAWMRKLVEHPVTGLPHIHGRVKQNGTVTHRAAHSDPNLAQVPKVGKPFGAECRSLFRVPEGWVMVGADASSLEARCLAHELYPYPGGKEYGDMLLGGDVHTANRIALGLPEGKLARDVAKTFLYAWLYGAGDMKIGTILSSATDANGVTLLPIPKGGWSEAKLRKFGKAKKEAFLANTPALSLLIEDIKREAKQGFVRLCDGRRAYVRSDHAALNTKLQGHGAVICKTWIARFAPVLEAELGPQGWEGEWAALLWVHDEVQLAVRERHVENVKHLLTHTMKELTQHFHWRVALDGEAKAGPDWKSTH